jgi:hypothetical protein
VGDFCSALPCCGEGDALPAPSTTGGAREAAVPAPTASSVFDRDATGVAGGVIGPDDVCMRRSRISQHHTRTHTAREMRRSADNKQLFEAGTSTARRWSRADIFGQLFLEQGGRPLLLACAGRGVLERRIRFSARVCR